MDKDTVKHIAHLARIQLDENDIPSLTEKLSRVMELIDQMNTIDTTGIEPMYHPFGLTQRLRDDVVTEEDQHEKFQAIAPGVDKDLYLVPKVVE